MIVHYWCLETEKGLALIFDLFPGSEEDERFKCEKQSA